MTQFEEMLAVLRSIDRRLASVDARLAALEEVFTNQHNAALAAVEWSEPARNRGALHLLRRASASVHGEHNTAPELLSDSWPQPRPPGID